MKKSLLITAALLMGTAGYATADNMQPTTFSQIDVNGDNLLSKAEAKGQLLDHFDELDKDGSGTLSLSELPMGMQANRHKGAGFAQMDKNSDQVISKDEAQGRLLANFDSLDKDANGTLSKDEIPMPMQDKGNKGNGFAQMDKNGDQVISKNEAQGRLLANFDSLDKDGNGTLSKNEIPMQDKGRQRPSFAQLDTNADGSLSESEYNVQPKHPQRRTFKQMDTNSDGVLDKSEVGGRLLAKFAQIDRDNSGTLTADELAQVQQQNLQKSAN